MLPLLQEFIAESREQLERGAAELAALEHDPRDGEAINALFRIAHTIKGSCRLFPLDPVARLASAAEDLLDAAREQEMVLERHHLDLLLQSFDVLEGWFDELEARGELDPATADLAATLAAEIRRGAGRFDEPSPAAASRVAVDCAWLGEVDEALRARLFEQHAGRTLVAALYEPGPDCFYAGEDPLYTLRGLPGLAALGIAPTEPWPELMELDVHRCRLRFFAFSTAPLAEVEEALRPAPGLVSLAPVEAVQLALPGGVPQTTPTAAAQANAALRCLDEGDLEAARAAIARLGGEEAQGWLASAQRWLGRLLAAPQTDLAALRNLLRGVAAGRQPAPAAGPAPGPGAEARAEAVRKLLQAQAAMLGEDQGESAAPGRLLSAAAIVRRCLRELGREDLEPALCEAGESGDGAALRRLIAELQSAAPAAAEPAPGPPARGRRAAEAGSGQLRIELRQMDRLMDLIAEMVVAKNSLPYLARQAEAQGQRPLARALKERHGAIHRIVEEMQATMAAVRLVPLAHVFRRLPRLVRDAARRVGKDVELLVGGEAVEADRRVVDALGEPLVHLVRNAVDHGIEGADSRAAAGKPRRGRLQVTARAEGDRLLLEVADDGRGIDCAAVRRQAYERGLIGEEALADLGEEAALQLLFRAGFSTRATVTEMSGRGVGLDVVRTAVLALGGSVSLKSRPGEGSRVQLAVPLSMATAEVMMVDAGGQNFGIPMAQIAQTLKLPRAGVHRVKRRRAFVLRGKVVPLLAAREALGLPPPGGDGDLSVLVARLDGGLLGLEVDRFGEVAEVVMKPLDGVLAGLRQYAGSAVLADGSVLLVLDLPRLLGHGARL